MPPAAAATVETRIAELVEARRPVLEELVAAAVDRALVELVDQELELAIARLAEQTNGAGPANSVVSDSDSDPPPPATATSTRLCIDCHERPAAARRSICSRCKSRRERQHARERRAAAVSAQNGQGDDESRPGDPEPGPAAVERTAPLCLDCGVEPAAHGRRYCASCNGRSRHERERRAAAAADQGGPARFRYPASLEARVRGAERRELIEAARRNRVEQIERDGRTYTLIHLQPEAGRLTASLDPA